MNTNHDLLTLILYMCSGILLASIAYTSKSSYQKYIKHYHLRRFWRPFIGRPVTIVVTEYPAAGSDQLSRIARIAGAGWLITKGMAYALACLLEFGSAVVTKRKGIIVCGDRTGAQTTDNLIVLGSPANNLFSRSMYKRICETFEIPFEVVLNETDSAIQIRTSLGQTFSPSLNQNGVGEDYALIVKSNYQPVPEKSVLIIAGCYMWGTEAGARAVTDSGILVEVTKECRGEANIAFIVKTRIMNNIALGPELSIDGSTYISVLQKK
jgi:hypothetical protein